MIGLVARLSSGVEFHLTGKQPLKAVLQNWWSTNLLNNTEKRLWRSATLLKLNFFTDIFQGFY